MSAVGRLPTPSHPPGGPQSLLAGGRASEAFRRPPTGQEGHLPPREVSLPPGGQNPITLEYQIYPPTIDTIVTGMPVTASCTAAVADPSFVSDHGAIVFLPGAMFMTSCSCGT